MVIRRKLGGLVAMRTIELTPEELRKAYDEQRHQFDVYEIKNELDLSFEFYYEKYDVTEKNPVTEDEIEQMAVAYRRMMDESLSVTGEECRSAAVEEILRKRSVRNFATKERMAEIANAAIDSFGELLNGRSLYDCLAGSLKMSDEEILAAGFTTLKEFMEEGDGQ